MIVAPAGWTSHYGVHLLTVYPPGGGARIRVRERLRPALRFSEVVRVMLADDPLFRVTSMHQVEAVTTDEGEYGAWARVNGVREGHQVTRFLAAIFADDFTVAFDAVILLREQLEPIRDALAELVVRSELSMGIRRRRFLYEPPAGWRAVPSGLVANWYPPGFPNDRAVIVVPPAEPSQTTVEAATDAQRLLVSFPGFAVEGTIGYESITSSAQLTGTRVTLPLKRSDGGEPKWIQVAAFAAPPYLYVLRFEAREDKAAHREVFDKLVRSVTPLPPPGHGRIGATALSGDAVAHWVD